LFKQQAKGALPELMPSSAVDELVIGTEEIDGDSHPGRTQKLP
jgi:hypothetical protein